MDSMHDLDVEVFFSMRARASIAALEWAQTYRDLSDEEEQELVHAYRVLL